MELHYQKFNEVHRCTVAVLIHFESSKNIWAKMFAIQGVVPK